MATQMRDARRRTAQIVAGAALIILLGIGVAWAALPPGGTFLDDDGSVFEGSIEAIAAEGITSGCNPPDNDMYCPGDNVTRGEMAVFLVRAMGYADNGGGNLFVDDNGLFYEGAADRLKTAGVTEGCNPPAKDMYCGERSVTRGEMAAFLVRAMGYVDSGGGDLFTDDNGSIFENAIDKLGTAGVTLGCNPPDNDMYCPGDPVTRGQMAAFLTRALNLTPVVPPPRPTTTTTTTTTTPACDPSYPTVCIKPPPPDLDCPDIPYTNFKVIGSDPHRFDGDNDGVGCET
jgi:hypothetical protein